MKKHRLLRIRSTASILRYIYVSWDMDGNLIYSPGVVGNAPDDKWRTVEEKKTDSSYIPERYRNLLEAATSSGTKASSVTRPGSESTAYPTQTYRDRILNTFGGVDKFMKAKHINPTHERANKWVSDTLAGMEKEYEVRNSKADSKITTSKQSKPELQVKEEKMGASHRQSARSRKRQARKLGMRNA